jgi:serine/threonine-protein kinase
MNEPHDPDRTVDAPAPDVNGPPEDRTAYVPPSAPPDSLDAGLAAGFGGHSGPPRSGLGTSQGPVLLAEADDSAHVIKPNSDAMPGRAEAGDRYQLFGEIARGGMGAVLRGRDVDLGRDLAVKVLLARHAGHPDVARRFLEEAQVGAQLQHPGVVPVYDVGRFGQRPYFTMKLVKGKTLAAILAERADPSQDRPRLLAVALQVSQAMAYAHAKGVIHRDLKPANVMVGAFGEVQVMDWGLAKVLAEGGVADEKRAGQKHTEEGTLIRTSRRCGTAGTHGTDTEAGSFLGTPAYVPPEQANGDVALLDRRCDVFGLGAILCEILTGRPPYVGRSHEELRRKAANGDLADTLARLDGCGADGELIALTKACLAPEAIDRPRDAQAVADGLTAYLDGVQERLRQAELAEAEAKARAIEEAKRRRLTLALAATVLLAVTLGGGGFLYVKSERDARRAHVEREVNDALAQAGRLLAEAKAARSGGAALLAQAREQAQRARTLAEGGPADEALNERVQALQTEVRALQTELDEQEADRTLLAALDEAWLAQTQGRAGGFSYARDQAVPHFRKAFAAWGLPVGKGEAQAAAQRIGQRPKAVRETAVAALDEWDELASDPDWRLAEPHRDWLRDVLEALAAAETADVWSARLRAARRLADPIRRVEAQEALAAAADVRNVPPQALAWLAIKLRLAAALALLRRAQEAHPGDFWVNHNLGMALREVPPPQPAEAVRYLSVAVALRPGSPGALVNLAAALLDAGRTDEAIACWQKSLKLAPNDPAAHHNLGIALGQKHRTDEAIAHLRRAIELVPEFAEAHHTLGVQLFVKERWVEAVECFRKAVGYTPTDARALYHLSTALTLSGRPDEAAAPYCAACALEPRNAFAHNGMGIAQAGTGLTDEAIASFRRAIEGEPGHAEAHHNLGKALLDKGRKEEAIANFRRAVTLDPRNRPAHVSLGDELYKEGRFAEAVPIYRAALKLDPDSVAVLNNLGLALLNRGQQDEAIACLRKAIDLEPKRAESHSNLGAVLSGLGKSDEAIACLRKAAELDPRSAMVHYNLGTELSNRGRLAEGIASLRKAVEIDPRLSTVWYNLGEALRAAGRADEAIASYRKALEIEPDKSDAHGSLGLSLLATGRFAEARRAMERGLKLLPQKHPMRAELTALLPTCRRLEELERRLPGLLAGRDRPASATEALELTRLCLARRMNAAAARYWVMALASEPGLADDRQAQHRYNAACAAALAAGAGKDAKLSDAGRLEMRRRALSWLRAELALWARLFAAEKVGRSRLAKTLAHWQKDADLAGLRDEAALNKLPAEERAACERLWADVAALLKKTEAHAK